MLKKAFIHKTDNTAVQLLRYLFVGGGAFVIDFTLFALLTEEAGMHYLVANLFAFTAGLLANYLISIRWVFATRSLESKRREFALFTTIGIIGLGLNQLLLWLLTDLAGIYVLASKILATAAVFLWNFFARRHLVFYR